MTTRTDHSLIGQAVGNYRIHSQIGEGGMGAVFMAEHGLIGRRAAIKVLLPELTQRKDVAERFFNEARVCAALQHPGIVQIYDFGKLDDGSAYIVMELLEGEPLSKRISKAKKLPVQDALAITHQIARALQAAHAKGVVHRDLKPDNVFIVPDKENSALQRVKLLDFGIAKLTEDGTSSGHTRTGAILGTPAYMSPEQCEGAGYVDHRSDLYAIGVILYEMLAGRVPFKLDGFGKILAAHLHVQPESPRTHEPSIPADVEALVMRLLIKDKNERPQTSHEVATAIEGLVKSLDLFARPEDPNAPAASDFRTPAPSSVGRTPSQPSAPSEPGPPSRPSTPVRASSTTLSNSVTTMRPPTQPSAPGAGRRGTVWAVAIGVVILAAGGGVAGVMTFGGGTGDSDDEDVTEDEDTRTGARATRDDDADETKKPDRPTRDDTGETDTTEKSGKDDDPEPGTAKKPEKPDKDDGGEERVDARPTAKPDAPATGVATGAGTSLSVVTHEIASTPPRARVYRLPENRLMGETPCKFLVEASPGKVRYAVRLAGHADTEVELPGGGDDRATVGLKKVKKAPAGAEKKPDEGFELPR